MRKVYGQSQNTKCVFCEKLATKKNKQGFTTCIDHVNEIMPDKKCICGEWLDIKESKWGAFYVCPNCGPISLTKANEMQKQQKTTGFKLNKKFREEKEKQEKELKLKQQPKYEDRIYTMTELLNKWNKEN